MKTISDLLKDKSLQPKKGINSERAYIISQIIDKLENERKINPFYLKGEQKLYLKPFTPKLVGIRLAYLKKNEDLYYLLSTCSQAKSFISTYHYLTKQYRI